MKSSAHDALLSLLRGLHADRAGYCRLQELLEAQFQSALRHEGNALVGLAEQITGQVAQLESHREHRRELMARLVGRDHELTMPALIQRLPSRAGQAVTTAWRGLEQLVRECKELNQRNCKLIIEQHALMQRLMGQDGALYAER